MTTEENNHHQIDTETLIDIEHPIDIRSHSCDLVTQGARLVSWTRS
jgi:hypothetical protein